MAASDSPAAAAARAGRVELHPVAQHAAQRGRAAGRRSARRTPARAGDRRAPCLPSIRGRRRRAVEDLADLGLDERASSPRRPGSPRGRRRRRAAAPRRAGTACRCAAAGCRRGTGRRRRHRGRAGPGGRRRTWRRWQRCPPVASAGSTSMTSSVVGGAVGVDHRPARAVQVGLGDDAVGRGGHRALPVDQRPALPLDLRDGDRHVGEVARRRSTAPSATSATIFSATKQPDARDSATPCMPMRTISPALRGNSTGMPSAASDRSLTQGTVEDLAPGSSPTISSTPPVG